MSFIFVKMVENGSDISTIEFLATAVKTFVGKELIDKELMYV